jgi:putative oxidoreductase
MFVSDAFRAEWSPRVLSVLRIVVALCFLQHGLTKFFGFPGAAPAVMRIYPTLRGGLIEFIGGLLLLVRLYTPEVAFIASGEMAVAYWSAHAPRGFFPYVNGGELSVVYCFVFLFIAFAGGGSWSLDQIVGHRRLSSLPPFSSRRVSDH